jgi:thioredoxin reductase (NADPH)
MNYVYDLIIVGAGPAGSSAALNASKRISKILIIEKNLIGGKVIKKKEIKNYLGFKNISGEDFSNLMKKHLDCDKIEFKNLNVVSVEKKNELFIVNTISEKFFGLSVIVATGSEEKKLEVKGEEKEGIFYYNSKEIDIFKEKNVAIIGGGYSACEAAKQISEIAKEVYIVNFKDCLNCDIETRKIIEERKNVKIFLNSSISKLGGKKKIKYISVTIGNDKEKIFVDNVIPCVGLTPTSYLVKNFEVCDEFKYIEVDPSCSTKIKGLFSVGDVTKKIVWQISNAVSDGAIAAQSAIWYLEGISKKSDKHA